MKLVKLHRKEWTKTKTAAANKYKEADKFYFVIPEKERDVIIDKFIRKEKRFFMFDTGEVDMKVNISMADGTLRAFMNENIPITREYNYKLILGKCQHCGSENCEKSQVRELSATEWDIRCDICHKVIRRIPA